MTSQTSRSSRWDETMLKRLRSFCRLLCSLPQSLEDHSKMLRELLTQQATIKLTMLQIIQVVDRVTRDNKTLVEQRDILRAFVSTVEAAGISRKFGSRIDVDYDKLLDNLGVDGEAEMMRTIKSRRDVMRQRLKVTTPSKVPVKKPYKPLN